MTADPEKSKAETYEDKAKALFLKQPANMKLLIVVAKLLTGFDAPSCSYIYLDKEMKDHGLFQAICRVNRLDSEDKMFGYIVDYKELFDRLVNEDGSGAMQVYTSELDYDTYQKEDCEILLKDRIAKGRERLDEALEQIAMVVEHVPSPKSDLEYIRYFCGNPENPDDLKETEVRRNSLYSHTVILIRAYANIAEDMAEAGYTEREITSIKAQLDNYLRLREIIRRASGETLDTKPYEADMRFLIDNYIQADPSHRIDPFADQSLLDLIELSGIAEAISRMPEGIKSSPESVAETIANNIRQKIIREHLIDPAYFEEMSKLLNMILAELREQKINYEESLARMAELTQRVNNPQREDMPARIKTPAQRALYNNLGKNEELAVQIDEAVKRVKQVDFRGDDRKERLIKAEMYKVLPDEAEVERIFNIIRQQQEY